MSNESPISEAQSLANYQTRLRRMIDAVARKPRSEETKALRAAYKRSFPSLNPDRRSLFVSMRPRTLSMSTLSSVDTRGVAHYKVDGLGAQAAWITQTLRGGGAQMRKEPPPYAGSETPTCAWYGRSDSVMFVLRSGEVLVVDCVPLPLRMNGRTILEGELCLRVRQLSEAVQYRYKARRHMKPADAFGSAYLDRDTGDERDDHLYELCFAVHDCLLADTYKQTNATSARIKSPTATDVYLERLMAACARATGRAVPPVAHMNAVRDAAQRMLEHGVETRPVRVFCKRPFPLRLIGAMIRCVPHIMRGIRVDGLVLTPQEPRFQPGVCMSLLRVKWTHTVDLRLMRDGKGLRAADRYSFYCADRDAPLPSAGLHYGENESEVTLALELIESATQAAAIATRAALFADDAQIDARQRDGVVLEFAPHITAHGHAAIRAICDAHASPHSDDDAARLALLERCSAHVEWQPVLLRVTKRRANPSVAFFGALDAIVHPCSLAQLCAFVVEQ